MTSEWELEQEFRQGSRAKSATAGDKPKRNKKGGRSESRSVEKRQPAPVANPGSSEVAQRFVDAAEAHGFRLPFNANFLAHRLSLRVTTDARLRPLLIANREESVICWLNKMVDLFWKSYVQTGDTAGNVTNVFLDVVWEDLRDYAFDSLRAAHLKQYGRTVPREEPVDHRETRLFKALEEIKMNEGLTRNLEVEPVPYESRTLDTEHREMLRSRRKPTKRGDNTI